MTGAKHHRAEKFTDYITSLSKQMYDVIEAHVSGTNPFCDAKDTFLFFSRLFSFLFFLSFEARLFLQTFRRELANVATVRTRIQKRSLGAVILLLVCV